MMKILIGIARSNAADGLWKGWGPFPSTPRARNLASIPGPSADANGSPEVVVAYVLPPGQRRLRCTATHVQEATEILREQRSHVWEG